MTKEELLVKIEEEYNSWVDFQYGGNDKKRRKELGQYYTPPELIIELLEKFDYKSDDFKNKLILDPTSGAGGLLIGCYYAGADIEKLYGIEKDKNILENVCWKRLDKIIDNDFPEEERAKKKAIIREHIHLGDALDKRCYCFDDEINIYNGWVNEQASLAKKEELDKQEETRKKLEEVQKNLYKNGGSWLKISTNTDIGAGTNKKKGKFKNTASLGI